MSFRAKLSGAFTAILLLTTCIALTNWWWTGRTLERQDELYRFATDLEHRLHLLVRSEQAYRATKDPSLSRDIKRTLEEIRARLDRMTALPPEDATISPALPVLDALTDYTERFNRYSRSSITLETMKSRLLKESRRLLSHTERFGLREQPAAGEAEPSDRPGNGRSEAERIRSEISALLLAEKEYVLNPSDETAATVNSIASAIIGFTAALEDRESARSSKLQAFRILRAARVYLGTFNEFVVEQRNQLHISLTVDQALDRFGAALSAFLDRERQRTRQSIANLQMLTAAITLAAVLFGVCAVILLSNLISRPINELRRSAQQIVDGNLETSVAVNSTDDIGQLGMLFNQMTTRLRNSFRHIEGYRDHLQQLVGERTEKLETEIAQHRITEEALRASNERLANIVNQSPVGIAFFDKTFRVVEWNPSCEKIFGYSRSEMIGKSAEIIIPETSRQQVKDVIQRLFTSGETSKNRNENVTKGGRIITCEWHNTPLSNSADEIIGMLSLVENVSEKLRLENELLKVKKLESTGVLAGGIAHDFNNILMAVLGNINLATLDDTISEDTRELLGDAEKATMRAQTLTQQLLTFAKGGEPVREQTSLAELIKDSADFILHGSTSTCRYHFPDDLWLIKADKGQISQVIQNIVLNAAQSMPGGGVIEIACRNVSRPELREELLDRDGLYVEISIRDQGVGIPESIVENIFDPYFSTKNEGSGLGLAITLSIINKHDGHISVRSEPGNGTVFTMYLPAGEAGPETPLRRAAEYVDRSGAHILLMDDDEMVLRVGAAMLRSLGYEVSVSHNGDDCIALYRERLDSGAPFDLVILDLTIPGGKGGEETVRELHRLDPEAKVIVSSGYSNDPIMSSYERYGFCAAISKPYVVRTLAEAVATALG